MALAVCLGCFAAIPALARQHAAFLARRVGRPAADESSADLGSGLPPSAPPALRAGSDGSDLGSSGPSAEAEVPRFGGRRLELEGIGDELARPSEGRGAVVTGVIASSSDLWWLRAELRRASAGGRAGVTPTPWVTLGTPSVSGRVRPAVLQHLVRQERWLIRRCYEMGLGSNAALQGRVVVRFVIGRDGAVTNVGGGGDLPDGRVVSCVTRLFYGLRFPRPRRGIATVSYPIWFGSA